jgi:hypothetical protein
MNPGWVAVMPQELFHPQQLAEEIPIRVSIMLTRESAKWSLNEMSLEEFTQLVIPITYTELEMAKSLFDYSSTGLILLTEHLRLVENVMVNFGSKSMLYRLNIPGQIDHVDMQRKVLDILEDILAQDSK